jgi:hypothetical protein
VLTVEAPAAVANGADLICLATASNVPVLFGEWLEPGQHVTSIVASNKGVSRRVRYHGRGASSMTRSSHVPAAWSQR